MILFIQTLELLSCPSTANIEIEALSFQAWEILLYFYKPWRSQYIVPNTGILAVFLYTLAFLSYPPKRWNFGPTFIHIEIVALSFQALEFWAYFYKHWNSHLIVPNTGILDVFLYTLAFLSYPPKRWNFGPTFIHIDFFYLILQNLGIFA